MASCARAGKPFFAILKPSAAGACALSPSRPSRPLHPRISALLPVSPNYWARPKSVATLRVLPTSPNGWAWMGGLPTPLSPCAADSGLVPRALSPSRVSIYITRIYIHTTEAASALVRQPASATAPNSAGGEGRGGGVPPIHAHPFCHLGKTRSLLLLLRPAQTLGKTRAYRRFVPRVCLASYPGRRDYTPLRIGGSGLVAFLGARQTPSLPLPASVGKPYRGKCLRSKGLR